MSTSGAWEVPAVGSSTLLFSPLRYVGAALAVTAGYAFVLEAEDQFHRAVWFGVLFAAVTGAWFMVASFLTLVDTGTTWRTTLGTGLASWLVILAAQFVPNPSGVDDTGELSEPLTLLRLGLTGLVTVAAAATLSDRWRPALSRSALATHAMPIGWVTLVIGVAAAATTAAAQSFSA